MCVHYFKISFGGLLGLPFSLFSQQAAKLSLNQFQKQSIGVKLRRERYYHRIRMLNQGEIFILHYIFSYLRLLEATLSRVKLPSQCS